MIGKSFGVTIYFTDPYASWQKWAIENANGLIRQYMSKTETFEHVSHQQITRYSKKMYVVKQKCTTANIVIYSVISFFYSQKFFC